MLSSTALRHHPQYLGGKKKSGGFSSKDALSPYLEQKPCLSLVTQGLGVCSSMICVGDLIDLPASVVLAVKLGCQAAIPLPTLTFSLIMQSKDWVRPGGWVGGRQTVGLCLQYESKKATLGFQPCYTHTLYKIHTLTVSMQVRSYVQFNLV